MPENVQIDMKIGGNAVEQVNSLESALKRMQSSAGERSGGGSSRSDRERISDEQLAKATKDHEEARKKSEARQREVARERMDSARYRVGIAGGVARGGVLGGMSAMGGYGAIATMGIEAIGASLEKVGKSAEILNNSFLTTSQKQRLLAEEFVPLLGSVRKMMDGISGLADQMARQEIGGQKALIETRVKGEYSSKRRAEEFEIARAQSKVSGFGAAGYTPVGQYDRQSILGAQLYEEEQLKRSALDAKTRALRGQEGARSAYRESGFSLQGKDRELAQAEQNYADARKYHERVREGYEGRPETYQELAKDPGMERRSLQQAVINEQQKSAELAQVIAQREEEVNRHKQRGLELAEAESQVRKADIELAKADLAILQARESRMTGMARSAGSMSQGEHVASLRALAQFAQHGPQGTMPETQALAARLNPAYVQQEQQKFGEQRMMQDKQFLIAQLGQKKVDEMFGKDFRPGETIADLQKSQQKFQAEIKMAVNLDEQQLAKDIVKYLEPALRALMKTISTQINRSTREIEAGVARQNVGK